jgi:hypothetical protein
MPTYDFAGNCHNIQTSWGSAAADTKRGRLIIYGGGHSDYAGNEVYSLDLLTQSTSTGTSCLGAGGTCSSNSSVPTLTRLNNPSIFSNFPTGNADGSAWSEHTYGSPVYLPKADKTVLFAGGPYPFGTDDKLWLLDMTTLTWHDTGYTDVGGTVNGTGSYCALDPTQADESIICLVGYGGASVKDLLRYDVATNTVTHLITQGSQQWQFGPGVVVDPDRKLLIVFGNDTQLPTVGAKLYVTDLTDPTYAQQDWTSTISGCGDLLNQSYPSLQWDATLHKVVGYVPRRFTTSSSTVNVSTGSRTFTIASGLPIATGASLAFEDTGTYGGNGEILGTVTSYSGTSLVINATIARGAQAGSNVTGWTIFYPFSAVVVFDPGMRQCVVNPLSSNIGVPQPDYATLALTRGTSGKFNYFPALGKYVVVNNFAGDAYTLSLNATPTNGLGSSTITCVDRDGDGYGTGPGCLGPDADDQDVGVHTGAQLITKWGTLTGALNHLGYDPTNIYYIAITGTDHSTAGVPDCKNNIASPCATFTYLDSSLSPGDMVMIRGGAYSGQYINPLTSGMAGAPRIYMAYPGEQPQWIGSGGLVLSGVSYVILDGLYNSAAPNNNACVNSANTHNAALRHIEATGCKWEVNATNDSGALYEYTIEESAFHDNWGLGCGTAEHGVYLSNHQDSITHQTATLDYNIFFRRNLSFKNCSNGLQMNGRFNNVVVEQNMLYSNDIGGIAFLSGVANSRVTSNLAFNNASTSFNIFGYPSFCNAYDSTGTNTCPANQNNNMIENNTFYATGTDPKTGAAIPGAAVIYVNTYAGLSTIPTNQPTYASGGSGGTPGTQVVTFTNGGCSNTFGTISVNGSGVPIGAVTVTDNTSEICTSVPTQGTVATVTGTVTFTGGQLTNVNPDFGHNTFRNNIMVSYSPGVLGSGYPQFGYDENVYPSTSTYQNNLFYSNYPTAGTYTNIVRTIVSGAPTFYNCATAQAGSGSIFGSFTNCQNADPKFISASPAYWNTPALFNFKLLSSSPGIAAGSVVQIPLFDVLGSGFSPIAPNLGSYEGSTGTSNSGSAIGGKGTFAGSTTVKPQ